MENCFFLTYQILFHPCLWECGLDTLVDTVAYDIRTKVCSIYQYFAEYNRELADYGVIRFFEESAEILKKNGK